jgi:O-antigen/teichoic acid export membrane protein
MSGIRRAVLLASGERYGVLAINLVTTFIIARLLGPAEFGVAVIGMAALALAETLREFGAGSYIVQERELVRDRLRSAFTISAILTLVLATLLVLLAGPIAVFYEMPGLEDYMRVTAVCYLFGPFVAPLYALMRRDMAFGKLAVINLTTITVYAVLAIALAVLGAGTMSFAWASLVSGATGLVLLLHARRDFWVFRPSLAQWRHFAAFGRYEATTQILMDLNEQLPFLVLGRMMDARAVGLYQRAVTICNLPRRALLGGFNMVILPALAAQSRAGSDLKADVLRAVSYVSVIHVPAMVMLAILAHPVVLVMLGPGWLDVVPLVAVLALAQALHFSVELTFSALIISGAVRRAMILQLIVLPASLVIFVAAAQFGLLAAALSRFATVGLELALSLWLVRRSAPFRWAEMWRALEKSALVLAATIAGPLVVVAVAGWRLDLGLMPALVAVVLAVGGWLAGVWLSAHPVKAHIWDLAQILVRRILQLRFGNGGARKLS